MIEDTRTPWDNEIPPSDLQDRVLEILEEADIPTETCDQIMKLIFDAEKAKYDELQEENRSTIIRAQNDRFRTSGYSLWNKWMMTQGVVALDAQREIVQLVVTYDNFNKDNDPNDEHDFGAFEFQGRKLFWKIDYYDNKLEHGSPDPADELETTRVLTIMLAEEY